jgi:hypothetical protein
MTSEEFTAICKRLFGRGPKGYGWQAEMHRRFGVSLRTLQAWAKKDNPVPPIVAGLLRMLDSVLNK